MYAKSHSVVSNESNKKPKGAFDTKPRARRAAVGRSGEEECTAEHSRVSGVRMHRGLRKHQINLYVSIPAHYSF